MFQADWSWGASFLSSVMRHPLLPPLNRMRHFMHQPVMLFESSCTSSCICPHLSGENNLHGVTSSPKSTLSTRMFELNKQLQRYTPHLNTANVLFSVLLAECNSILHDTRLEINAENKRPGWYLADLEVLVVMSEKAKYHVDMLDKRVQSLRCELNFVKSLITKLQWREKNPTTPHENGAHRDKLKQRLKRVHFDPDVIMNHGKSKRVARQKPNTTISIDRQGATRIRCGAAATSPPDRACCGALLTSSTSPPLPATPPLGSRGQQQAEVPQHCCVHTMHGLANLGGRCSPRRWCPQRGRLLRSSATNDS